MQHIQLDTYSEPVKRFILSLTGAGHGTVLELAGRPVACVLPMSTEKTTDTAVAWTEAKNTRRCALIDREIDGTLTPEETEELRGLQAEMIQHRQRVAPLPLAEARRLHQELLQRAQVAP